MAHMPTSSMPTDLYAELTERVDAIDSANDAQNGLIAIALNLGGAPIAGVDVPVFNILDFGALANGTSDDSTAVRSAMAAAALAGGGVVFFPEGVSLANKAGASAWCYDVPGNNITFRGVSGKSVVRMKAGQPSGSVPVFRVDGRENITFEGLEIDGNWGAVVGVTTDKSLGINHGDNSDPDSHGLFVRGVQKLTIDNCKFTQCYGDAIWIGTSTSNYAVPSRNIRITRCDFDIMGRSGVALGQKVDGFFMQACRFTNIMATCFDTEPSIGGRAVFVRDITVDACEFNAGFWNPEDPARSINCAMSIVGASAFSHPTSTARKYRVTKNKIRGQILIAGAEDVILDGNEIVCDWDGYSYSPILCWFYSDQVQIINNAIYDRTEPATGDRHEAAIAIQYSGNGNANWAPKNVVVRGNMIRARNGRAGIRVMGTGGGAYGTTGTLRQAGTSGTASAVDNTYPPDATGISGESFFSSAGNSTSVSKTTSTWTINQWVGWVVRSNVSACIAEVTSNTGNTLTFTGGWKDLDGNAVADPQYIPQRSFSLLPTMTDLSKAWIPNEWTGRLVLMGGKLASIMANYATKLVLDKNAGWTTPFLAEQVATPSPGPYRILPVSGTVVVDNNDIDCTDDGHGAGAEGIQLHAYRAGMRVECTNNRIRNATGPAIVLASASSRPFIDLKVIDNKAWDDQPTPTCTAVVKFTQPAEGMTEWNNLVLRGNQARTGVAAVTTGLTAGTWLVNDGKPQEWAGYGAPTMSAPKGSTYRRLDGGAGTCFYVNESGSTTWVAK